MSDARYNRLLGGLRKLGIAAVIAGLVYFAEPTPTSIALGLIPVALGEAVRFWAAGYLLKSVELVTAGPYRYTRNPLYLGRLLIFSGLCIMVHLAHHASWVALAAGWALFFGYYLPRKERVEPARLLRLHGETFEKYHREVPALFPSLHPYAGSAGQRWSRQRMLRNREHLMVVGLTLATLLLLWRM